MDFLFKKSFLLLSFPVRICRDASSFLSSWNDDVDDDNYNSKVTNIYWVDQCCPCARYLCAVSLLIPTAGYEENVQSSFYIETNKQSQSGDFPKATQLISSISKIWNKVSPAPKVMLFIPVIRRREVSLLFPFCYSSLPILLTLPSFFQPAPVPQCLLPPLLAWFHLPSPWLALKQMSIK